MKSIFAAIGFTTVVLGLFGSLGFGNFVYMYSDKTINCTKGEE
jgi:hypothetical protein